MSKSKLSLIKILKTLKSQIPVASENKEPKLLCLYDDADESKNLALKAVSFDCSSTCLANRIKPPIEQRSKEDVRV